MSRTLVIGDIHGNFKGLQQVLNRCQWQPDDTIIQLGDVADGWSETPECVELLLSLDNLVSIRGNHDVWTYDWFEKGTAHHIWTSQGGQPTIDAYVRTGKLQDKEHKKFWRNQKDWYIDDKNRLFIHAGWDYTYVPPETHVGKISDEKLFELQAGKPVSSFGKNVLGSISKECHWTRDVYFGAQSGAVINKATGEPTGFKALNRFNEVYIGHTATKNHLPHNCLNLWNLDTGAGWHGKLTIMDIDTKEYWQSDLCEELYPDEKGRR